MSSPYIFTFQAGMSPVYLHVASSTPLEGTENRIRNGRSAFAIRDV